MPSIKKRVTGFIRQLSAPAGALGSDAGTAAAGAHGGRPTSASTRAATSVATARKGSATGGHHRQQQQQQQQGDFSNGFIQQYLRSGEPHPPGPCILSGKTGSDLPVLLLSPLSHDIFAAFTGPDGGLTSLARGCGGGGDGRGDRGGGNGVAPDAAEDSEDFDFIDLEDLAAGGASKRRESDGDAVDGKPVNGSRQSSQGGDSSCAINVEAVIKEKNANSEQASAAFRRRQRELSVESDYPELGMDFPMRRPSPTAGGGCGVGASPSKSSPHSAAEAALNNQLLTRRLKQDLRNDCDTPFAGVRHWNRPNNAATGQAVTLYERHPHTAEHAGSPIADTFAVVARKNSCILALGDGVNWGPRAALASRCAVHGAVEALNAALFAGGGGGDEDASPRVRTTQEVFQHLLRSFHAAHSLILQEEAHLTTLTACVVLPVRENEEEGAASRFVACVCNVGDSLAYVYSPSTGHVREVTQGSHDIRCNRDMRDALGALGPVDGINPELGNLTCSMTFLDDGDIVFLTSDGISDNFDPVVGKFCAPARETENGRRRQTESSESSAGASGGLSDNQLLPTVEAFQRHELTLLRLEDLLNHGSHVGGRSSNGNNASEGRVTSAAELCHRLVDFCHRLTSAKRGVLEDPELYSEQSRHALPDSDATRAEQKQRRRKVCEKLSLVPGKLDHATVVAFAVQDRRKVLRNYIGTRSDVPPTIGEESAVASASTTAASAASLLALRAPCASSEDLTFRDSSPDDDDDEDERGAIAARSARRDDTPTPSDVSLADDDEEEDGGGGGGGSLAVTPVHQPRKAQSKDDAQRREDL